MKPLVSVIVPVYNAARFIDEALTSVEQALDQIEHELIIVDDGSTDELRQVLMPWKKKIIFLTQENQGSAAARNKGIEVATGSFIAFIDADDVWLPNHFMSLYQELVKHPESDIATGFTQRYQYVDSTELKNKPLRAHKKYGKKVYFPSFVPALFRSQVFQQVGLLTPNYRWHEDIDWYLRAREVGIGFSQITEVIHLYRMHEHNITKKLQPTDRKMLRVLAASLKRRQDRQLSPLNGKKA